MIDRHTTTSLALLLYYLVNLLELEGEEKCTSFLVFGYEVDVTFKLLNDKLTDDETKSNSLDVNLFGFIFD